jgi:hypothetical protein
VHEIFYSVNGTQFHSFSSPVLIQVTSEGTNTIDFFAQDNAGNTEASQSITIKLDKTAPTIEAVPDPAPNANGWNNTDVTVSFNASDALSGIFSSSSPVTLTNEGAGQLVTGTAMDQAGNSASVNITINIDKTAPEGLVQFDPVTNDLQVFGRDALSGVLSGPVSPGSVIPQIGSIQRTYTINDLAGNTLTLVLQIQTAGRQIQAEIISLQYNSGAILSAPGNSLRYDWQTDANGVIRKLDQDLRIDGSPDQEVDAEFRADQNQTVITTKRPKETTVQTGLMLLRLASAQGQLVIEY